jgi:hypothetical protein
MKMKSEETGLDLDAPADETPEDQEVQSIYESIKRARDAAGPAVDQSQFDQQEQEAKSLYEGRANRNEWLSLADRIGNALVRIGAAEKGLKSGVDMSGINYGPMTDWDKRTDQAQRDYTTELGRVDKHRSSALKDQDSRYDLAGKAFDIAQKSKAQKAQDARQEKQEEGRNERQRTSIASQENRADARLKFQEDAAAAREERARRDADVKDLTGQETSANKQLQAKQQLFNQMQGDLDISSKDRSKLEATYGKLAAEAGVDLGELQAQLKNKETSWQIFGGNSTEEDNKAKDQILKDSIQASSNLRDSISRLKEQRLRGGKQEPAPTLKEPTPEQVQKYMDLNKGVTQQQATDILRKRLNQ